MIASSADAPVVAALLQAFSEEFGDPTPGVDVLAERLVSMDTVALLAGEPAVGVALVTFRPSVWTVGPTALLEELYVVPGQRGRGHGRALLLEAMDVARERGAETFELYTGEGDAAARALYRRSRSRSGLVWFAWTRRRRIRPRQVGGALLVTGALVGLGLCGCGGEREVSRAV